MAATSVPRPVRTGQPLSAGMRLLFAAAFTLAMLGTAMPATAIVINDAAGELRARSLGAAFSSVVSLRLTDDTVFCTGTLISPVSVLTARHCVPNLDADDVVVHFTDGNGNSQDSRPVASIFRTAELTVGTLPLRDLAILELADAVLNREPMHLINDIVDGELGRLVGYGCGGLGSTGAICENPPGQNAYGVRRGAENVIDRQFFPSQTPGWSRLTADFDDSAACLTPANRKPIAFEGALAPGDSGSPVFVNRAGGWFVAGIGSVGPQPGRPAYCDHMQWEAVFSPAATTFIRSNAPGVAYVPVPASAWMLGAIVAFPLLRWRPAA